MSVVPFRTILDDYGHNWLVHDPFRDQFFGNVRSGSGLDLAKPFAPLLTMDVVESETEYKVMADLPGCNVEDLDLTVEGHTLVMKAERKHVHEETTDKIHHLERSYGCVKRKIVLPKNADMNNVTPKFVNGVLTVTVPKLAEVPPASRKLEINQS